MAYEVVTVIDAHDGEEVRTLSHPEGTSASISEAGHLFIGRESGATDAIYAPGQWQIARLTT